MGEADSSLICATEQPLAQLDSLLSQKLHLIDHRPQLLFVPTFIHLCRGLLVSAVPTQPEHNCLIPVRPVTRGWRCLMLSL